VSLDLGGIWAQADRRALAAMQFVVAVGFATLRCLLLRALDFFDNTDCLMVFAICVPSLGWLRLMLIPTLNTSDRTRTTWATARHAGHQHLAGFNPNLSSVYGMQSLKTWSQPARLEAEVTDGLVTLVRSRRQDVSSVDRLAV
jgi:hypothetical protein